MIDKQRIDLHIHTNISDGVLTPIEVIDEANKNGVSAISITDHDTIAAYNSDLFNYANKKEIKLINGVEISTKIDKCGIHVLGYSFDLSNKQFKDRLKKIRNARHEYLKNVVPKLKNLGFLVNVNELNKIDAVTKAHIALDIINNSQNKEILIKEFGHVPNKGEFIETIMNENCPAYVKKTSITPKQAAEMIREAGGTVVLAHPVAYEHEDNLTDKDIIQIVEDMKPDGLEANYLYVDRNNKMFDETIKWNKFAIKHNLFVTIGSDFHNIDEIRPKIGFVNTNFDVDKNEINEIIKNVTKNKKWN